MAISLLDVGSNPGDVIFMLSDECCFFLISAFILLTVNSSRVERHMCDKQYAPWNIKKVIFSGLIESLVAA
jgi:hypothetical protein